MDSSAYKVTLINALVLIVLSLWGYFSVANSSPTALIPCIFGVIFLALSPGVKKHNKVVAHIVVVLTLLIVIALVKPLTSQMGKDDINITAVIRVSLMMLSSCIALIVYIRSFIEARKNKD